nr:MAG TPA: chlorophyll a/b-binding protein-like protein [Caudoviricetes sp.]
MASLRDMDHIMALFALFWCIHFVYFKQTKCSLKIRQR